jgi:Uma2 family endonuclease
MVKMPFICIEILSRKDTLARTQERIDDYLNFGVRHVWLINPLNRRAWAYTADGSREVKNGVLRTECPSISIPLDEIFAGLE